MLAFEVMGLAENLPMKATKTLFKKGGNINDVSKEVLRVFLKCLDEI